MSLLAFYGFNHCNQSVASDGSSPVNGVGPDTWPYPSTGVNGLTTSGGTTSNPIGVVSATTQAMGKAPKRQPLSMLGSSSQTSDLLLTMILKSTPSVSQGVGFRMRAVVSSDAAWASASTMIIQAGPFQNWPANTVTGTMPSVDTATGCFEGSTVNVLDGKEHYVETWITFSGGQLTIHMTVDGIASTALPLGSPVYDTSKAPATVPFSVGIQSGALTAGTVLLSISDIYTNDSAGSAPYDALLGPVKVVGVKYDQVTGTAMAASPTTSTLAEAIASVGDDITVQSQSIPASLTAALSEAPSLGEGVALAMQSYIDTTNDEAFTGKLEYTEADNSDSATAVTIALNGSSPTRTITPMRTTLPSGAAIASASLAKYSIEISAAAS